LQKIFITYAIEDAEYITVDTQSGTYEQLQGFEEKVTESIADFMGDSLEMDLPCEEF
jgi:hypothetical protein